MSLTKEDVQIIKGIVNDSQKETIGTLSDVINDFVSMADKRFTAVDKRFDGIDQRLDGIDRRFDKVEVGIRDIKKGVKDVQADLSDALLLLGNIAARLENVELIVTKNDEDIEVFSNDLLEINKRMNRLEKAYG